MDDELRPLPFDPSAVNIVSMFDLDSDDWEYSDKGDYETCIVQAFKRDGTNPQTLLALTWPMRNRRTKKITTLRLLIHPEDAANLADTMKRSLDWLRTARLLGN